MSDILVHTEAGITTLTFNRPDKKNSITAAMYGALADAIAAAATDPAVRVVVFQGNETTFSAGNDIGDFLNNPPATEDSPVFRFLRGIAQFPKPLLAAVCGPAAGQDSERTALSERVQDRRPPGRPPRQVPLLRH